MTNSFRDFVKNNKQPVIIKKPVAKVETPKIVRKTESAKPIEVKEKIKMENEAFNEAQTYIKNLKKKIDTVFYRFGMSGLERIDEAIIGTLNEMLHPELKQTIKESRRVPSKISSRKPAPKRVEPVIENEQTNIQSKPQKTSTSESALEQSAQALLGVLSQQAALSPEMSAPRQTGGMSMDSIEALSMALDGNTTNEED